MKGYNLEHKILLNENLENNSHHSWSIKEDKIEREFFPLDRHNFSFTACEFLHYYTLQIDSEDEYIVGKLYPSTCRDGKIVDDYVTYSMFGTERKINFFELCIKKNKSTKDKPNCHLYGFISFTEEFVEKTTEDQIFIDVNLTPQQFNNIVEQIKAYRVTILEISFFGPSGFYSEYPFSESRPIDIKILADSKNQTVVMPADSEINPPRLGDNSFYIRITQTHLLNQEQNNDEKKKIQKAKEVEESLLSRLEHIEDILNSTAWLITIILCFLLIKFIFLK